MSLVKTSSPRIKNLGQLVSMITTVYRSHEEQLNDMDAFGAPSECSIPISRAFDRRLEELDDQIFIEYGVSLDYVYAEAERRTSSRWAYFNLHN